MNKHELMNKQLFILYLIFYIHNLLNIYIILYLYNCSYIYYFRILNWIIKMIPYLFIILR